MSHRHQTKIPDRRARCTELAEVSPLGNRLPGRVYLWLAVAIFGSAGALTRKITDIGALHPIDGRNPISLCNILFVGNLCALLVLVAIHRHELNVSTLARISQRQWWILTIVAILSGALAPGLVFQALASTSVTNVVLIGRLEPPLTLILSIWLLRERVNRWEFVGAIVAFVGVILTILLQPMPPQMPMRGISIGWGELFAAIAAIAATISTLLSKKRLGAVPLSVFNIVRTGVGTIVFFSVALGLYGHDHFGDLASPFLWQWMLLYGTIVVVGGQSFWNVGMRRCSVVTVATIGAFAPIFGILAAYVILGEVPIPAQYIGGSVILVSLYLSRLGSKRRSIVGERVNSVTMEREIESRIGFKGM